MSLSKILNRNPLLRQQFFELFKNDVWKTNSAIDLKLSNERLNAFNKLKNITDNKLINVHDFKINPSNIFDAHEYVGYVDGSTSTKMTVQFNLFGGTIKNFGTKKHNDFLDGVNNLNNVGCFAFTEKGYGNNAFKMETTITYNKNDNTFIINSPTDNSKKSWITNSVCHANYAVVFGQLFVDNKSYGPHPILVKIRDNNGNLLDNIKIIDMGRKIGLNGVDNGIIEFNNFVTNADLLGGNMSHFDNNNNFVTIDIKNRNKFLNLTDQLVSGRICISSMMLGCTKMILHNTVRYANNRFSVGRDGNSTMKIINYGVQQNVLIPLIVRTIGLNLLLNKTKIMYANTTNMSYSHNELVRVACSVKPMLAWHTQEIITKCRELTGGEGFKIDNQFGEGFAASQAGITAEGDSKVLIMKTITDRMKELSKDRAKFDILKMQLKKITSMNTFTMFKNKEDIIISDLMIKILNGNDFFDICMFKHADLIQSAGKAYCENLIYDVLEETENMPENKNISSELSMIKKYFVLDCITRDPMWYTQNSFSTFGLNNAVKEKNNLELKMKNIIDVVVDSFDFPEHIITAPMAINK